MSLAAARLSAGVPRLDVPHQVANSDLKRVSDALQAADGGLHLAIFYSVHVGAVDPSQVGELLLRYTLLATNLSNRLPDYFFGVLQRHQRMEYACAKAHCIYARRCCYRC